jgi:hypothetical protein
MDVWSSTPRSEVEEVAENSDAVEAIETTPACWIAAGRYEEVPEEEADDPLPLPSFGRYATEAAFLLPVTGAVAAAAIMSCWARSVTTLTVPVFEKSMAGGSALGTSPLLARLLRTAEAVRARWRSALLGIGWVMEGVPSTSSPSSS